MAAAILSALLEVTYTSAPIACPINWAAAETPPPTPTTSSTSPACRRARRSILMAVPYASPYDPAATRPVFDGRATTLRAGTTAYSARVPLECSPRIPYDLQKGVSPARQAAQRPHDTDGLTVTASPTETPPTSSPTASITPVPSAPAMCGKR